MKRQIEFSNLSVSMDDRVLYNNMNLTINSGDRYIIFGPNGAGKSLLMNLISSGYSKALADNYNGLSVTGKILDKDGKDLLDPSTKKRIAYAPQNEEPYNNSTIYTEAETACNGVETDFDEKKLDYLLQRFNITHLKKKKINQRVSGGESKLISLITRILMLKSADIMLLDEPLNHLSFENSMIFNEIMHDEIIEHPELAIIMVSHCRAVDFINKSLKYDDTNKILVPDSYTAYDCFTHNFK